MSHTWRSVRGPPAPPCKFPRTARPSTDDALRQRNGECLEKSSMDRRSPETRGAKTAETARRGRDPPSVVFPRRKYSPRGKRRHDPKQGPTHHTDADECQRAKKPRTPLPRQHSRELD